MPMFAFCHGSAMAFSNPPNALKSQGRVFGPDATTGVLPPRRSPVTVAQWARMRIFETRGFAKSYILPWDTLPPGQAM